MGKKKDKKKGSRKHAKPVAAMAGVMESAIEMAVTSNVVGASPVDQLINQDGITNKLTAASRVLKENLMTPARYTGAGVGVGLSAAKKIPGLRVLAKPVDQVIKDMTKDKYGL